MTMNLRFIMDALGIHFSLKTTIWLSYESSIHRAKEEISLKSLVFSFALIFNNLWKTKDSLSYNRS